MPTKIDWCDETINPLGHGCYGPDGTAEKPNVCPYCYAKTIAQRGMRGCEKCKAFIPHTHFEQLARLQTWKKPKTVFVQSMGDLFHDAIPDEWISEVFKACEAAPQHRYLFLTKNHKCYKKGPVYYQNQVKPKDNWWFGASHTKGDMWSVLMSMSYVANSFVSIEPLRGYVHFPIHAKMPKWVIVGAESGSRKDKIIPKKEWIQNIADMCGMSGVPVFMKESLRGLMGDEFIQQKPF